MNWVMMSTFWAEVWGKEAENVFSDQEALKQKQNTRLTLVNRLEAGLFPVIKTGAKLNLRDCARTKVSDSTCTSGSC